MEAAIAVIPRPSLLLSRDVPCECSISEGIAIVPLARHRFLTSAGNSMAASMHASMKMFWRPKIQKTDGLILVPSHQKFDILESFVCS